MSAESSSSSGPVRHAGRYEIRERIGEGAMGVVYVAFDPKLHRKLAVKFVTPRRDSMRARERLLREAQAMARVNHPNVVSIYDVGEASGQVFIAMDYVGGGTLTKWLRQAPRGWREVVQMFVQAGRGLAAAHTAGLVHRDFKPDNVLVDEAGVARVTDFGLVVGLEESTRGDTPKPPPRREQSGEQAQAREGDTLADDTWTRTGVITGTLAYMAPEQSQGLTADHRSDQFSFCVALFEGLYGHRPSAGPAGAPTPSERRRIGARRPDIPARIHAAIGRGLALAPSDRWPSMSALLDELERVRFNVSPRTLVALAGVLGLVTLAFIGRERVHAWWRPVTLTFPVATAQVVEPMALHASPGGDTYAASAMANKGKLEIDLELPSSGRYFLHGLVWERELGGERGDADSFFVYVDGGEEKLWHFGCANQVMPEHVLVDNWAWQPVLHMANADSDCELGPELSWELDAGPHTIVFRNREDAASPEQAARIARVVITNQPGWRP
ncbi:serine/threonine-protein kinase [Nannocystaceae bacterium ST9]